MTQGGFVEILLRMTEEVIMEKEYLLFRAGSGLGVQGEFKEACADFLRIVLCGRYCTIAIARHKNLHID
jgi:hypothetical protein